MHNNTPPAQSLSEYELVGNKYFLWDIFFGHTVYIYIHGSTGPTKCFSMYRSNTGAIKSRSHGNWKMNLYQHEWVYNKAISLFKEYDAPQE